MALEHQNFILSRRGRPSRRQSAARRGYVLPMTLLVIALTALVLVGYARRSLQTATAAVEAERRLQQTWGAISCQHALLDHAESVLSLPTENGAVGDRAHRRIVFELGGQTFDALIADENAKINLNRIRAELPPNSITQLISELSKSEQPVQVSLRPFVLPSEDRNAEPSDENPATMNSWGQVFPMQQFSDSRTAALLISSASVDVTCWGDGRLNVLRASDAVIESLFRRRGMAGIGKRLVSARGDLSSMPELLATLELDPDELEEIGGLLIDHSSTFSMWLSVSSGNRRAYEFHVVTVPREEPDEEEEQVVGAARTPSLPTGPPQPIARFAF